MSGKGKITCAKLREAAEQKAEAGKITERALTVLDEIIAIRKNEEEVETQRNHDGITATGAPDEEPNWELLQVSWLASKHGRGRYPVRSPEDQIEEISPTSPLVEPSSGFTPSSHPSTSEAPAKPMYYRGSPEEQIETTSPASPSVRSSPRLTPSLYPSTSEASANLLYYHGQYHTPYTVAQSINLGASTKFHLLNTQFAGCNQLNLYSRHTTPAAAATAVSWLNIAALAQSILQSQVQDSRPQSWPDHGPRTVSQLGLRTANWRPERTYDKSLNHAQDQSNNARFYDSALRKVAVDKCVRAAITDGSFTILMCFGRDLMVTRHLDASVARLLENIGNDGQVIEDEIL
ncbi:hypothetical protein CNMCM5878_004630 [Aspergillus fumigatiaffinis]|nr:hypothetical protein CNMCM5878_004630 [Aspergillus fumigatiaffinis]